jgi:soluble lytic murein transglycosylase-like protein
MNTGLGIWGLGFSPDTEQSGGFAFSQIQNPKSKIQNPKSQILLPASRILLYLACMLFASGSFAGAQREESLSAGVRAGLQRSVADQTESRLAFDSQHEAEAWLKEMSRRLRKRIPDAGLRLEFLGMVHLEAKRAGLEPELVLGLIEVESGFRKYAVSKAGARGYMQVMPFWTRIIGANEQHNLFDMRTNLRYGCAILSHYLKIEKGDLFRALGRYNGSLGRPEYPNLVRAAWRNNWASPPRTADSGLRQTGG